MRKKSCTTKLFLPRRMYIFFLVVLSFKKRLLTNNVSDKYAWNFKLQVVLYKMTKVNIELFDKDTKAKEKGRISVKFQDKDTNFSQRSEQPCQVHQNQLSQLTSLMFGTKIRTFHKTLNSPAKFTRTSQLADSLNLFGSLSRKTASNPYQIALTGAL